MKNRPESYMLEGRISRDWFVQEEYESKTKAEILTLQHYFSEEWFDKTYILHMNIKRSRLNKRLSHYPLQNCTICNKTWNLDLIHNPKTNRKVKVVEYWDNYERLPKPNATCLNCQ